MASHYRSRLAVLALAHAALLAAALSPVDALWSRPLRGADYSMHFYTARHMADRLAESGRLWGYDPGWMAGYPESTLALVDNKLFGFLLLLAPRSYDAAAFNAAVLLILLSVPWLLYGAAKLAGSSALEASGAALAGTALTFGAPLTVLFWSGGAISFFFASLLAVLAALGSTSALSQERFPWGGALAAALLAATATFVHPLAMLVFGAALAPLLWTAPKDRWLRALAALLTLGVLLALTLLPVAAGLEANRQQLRPILPHGPLFPGGIRALVFDWWTYLLHPRRDGFFGAGSLAPVVLLAIIGLSSRAPTERVAARWALGSAMLGGAFLAYFAPSLWGRAAAFQPHRFLIPLGFFAAVPAGWGIARLWAALERRWVARGLAVVLALVVVQAIWTLRHNRVLGSGVDPAEPGLASFLAEVGRDGGRVLVEIDFILGPLAPGSSRSIGMFRFTLLPLQHAGEFLGTDHMETVIAERYATFREGRLFGIPLEKLDSALLRQLLDRYAVSAAVACAAETRATFDRFGGVLEPIRDLADCRGYRVRDSVTSRVLEGRADVRARLDRIEVRGAEGPRLVLKYHWIPALRTEPPLPIEEAPQPGAAVGFISVRPQGTGDFDIVVAPSIGIGELLRRAVLRALGF